MGDSENIAAIARGPSIWATNIPLLAFAFIAVAIEGRWVACAVVGVFLGLSVRQHLLAAAGDA